MAPPPKSGSPELLAALRAAMAAQGLAALVVPSEDAHQSEYTPERDRRREYVSGFTGSAGTAVITADKALLWTDGRYFLQAEKELSGEWALMKALEKGVPTVEQWLADSLPKGSVVGVNGYLLSLNQARSWRKLFDPKGLTLTPLTADVVDGVWASDQPPAPDAPIRVHPLEFAGQPLGEKLGELRAKLTDKGVHCMLVSALDEVAWLFNIRGGDVEFNPVVISYAVVTPEAAVLFLDTAKITPEVKAHLGPDVSVAAYEEVGSYLQATLAGHPEWRFLLDANQASLALASLLPSERVVEAPSPITLAKAIKNERELEGMRQAHIRDGAALVAFFAWLERALEAGASGDGDKAAAAALGGLTWPLTEASIAAKLEEFRAKQPKFVSLSFATISAVDANGAIIHYKPADEGSAPLLASIAEEGSEGGGAKSPMDLLLLLDSGAQYLDGTTDVTRTVHFGTPTPEEKEAFTLVLQGHIALAQAVFPEGTMGSKLDILARLPLWSRGLDYKHGTGHGVGAFLNVHEGPQSISYKKRPYEEGLAPGMVTSNEPGFYADGRFGIRIESLIICNEAGTPNRFGGVRYCNFETITMAPIQTKLVDAALLTPSDRQWLNEYHAKVRASLAPLLKDDPLATAYLLRETEAI